MSAPSIAATDPQALWAFLNNALIVAGEGLDNAAWQGSTLGASFPKRYTYPGKPPWDQCGQLVGYLSRSYMGQQGIEMFITAPPTSGEYGFHSATVAVEAVTCVSVQGGTVPPSAEQMSGDAQFVYGVGWCMFVTLIQAIASGKLVAPAGRVLVGPLEPSGERGGFASVTCTLSLQI